MKTVQKCYMCDEPATSVEHVPAKCFFPPGFRDNLITVPSCSKHNNDTSTDDEYVRGIIVSAEGNNEIATDLWKGPVLRGYNRSPKLSAITFRKRIDNSFEHNRIRFDKVIKKIAYGLYYHIYKTTWSSYPMPFYNKFFDSEGISDLELRFADYERPNYKLYDGANPSVFKYQYFEGKINSEANCHFILVFFDSFEVIIMPIDNPNAEPFLALDIVSK